MAKFQTQIERLREEREQEELQLDVQLTVEQMKEMGLTGFEDKPTRQLVQAGYELRRAKVATLRPLLPALLSLKGQPYTLADHYPFEPFFRTKMPKKTLLRTGRQVSKSTSLAAQGICLSATVPYFSTLYVTPLFEMIRRFSHNYVGSFLKTSPVARVLLGSKVTNSVLQRSFANGSTMYFSFAFLDADRTRGLPCDRISLDEIQDLNYEFLPIIRETMGGSSWGLEQYAGTPKSLDNTIEKLWSDSSQAEWIIKCPHAGCGHWNVPRYDHDLLQMIGPWSSDISEKNPGIVCAKCSTTSRPRRLNPRTGRWFHFFKERRWKFAGYHVPQIIMPFHCMDHKKWDVLVAKRNGKYNTPFNIFLNEVCGEGCDLGSKLVTETDLKEAACLEWHGSGAGHVEEASQAKVIDQYLYKILAVDWGGGGGRLRNSGGAKKGAEQRERTSFTVLAVMGVKPDGKIDVIWGIRSMRTHDHIYEAKLILAAMRRFKCSHLVHDYNGAGASREAILTGAGFPVTNIIPIAYHPSARKGFVVPHPPTDDHPRHWFSVDKSRSLAMTCDYIKAGLLRFFQYDYENADNPGLIHDFLALIEEQITSRMSHDGYFITKNPNSTDDFAQAVNIGTVALNLLRDPDPDNWPDIADHSNLILPDDLLRYCSPQYQPEWDDFLLRS